MKAANMVISEARFLLIIGAMKCGTSSIFEYLEGHPQICPSFNKEPEYFSERQSHRVNVERYEDLWPNFDPSRHRYAMEGSTGYTKYPTEKGVAGRISAYGIQPKLIYILRDPFERIISHYNFMRAQYPVPLDLDNPNYVVISDYGRQLKEFDPYFPKENFLLLDFEELKSDPQGLLDKIHRFLGIEEGVYPDGFTVVNSLQLQSSPEAYLEHSRLRKVLSNVPAPIKGFARRQMRRFFPQQKRVLTEIERRVIHEKLEPGMQYLKEHHSFEVSKWGF